MIHLGLAAARWALKSGLVPDSPALERQEEHGYPPVRAFEIAHGGPRHGHCSVDLAVALKLREESRHDQLNDDVAYFGVFVSPDSAPDRVVLGVLGQAFETKASS